MTSDRVRYSIAAGRPFRELKSLGHTVTWAAWWTTAPSLTPFVRPDAFGGARHRDDVRGIVRQHADSFLPGAALELLPASFGKALRAHDRAERDRLEREKLERWRVEFFTKNPQFAWINDGGPRTLQDWARHDQSRGPAPVWAALLGLNWPKYSEDDVSQAFRTLAFERHSDRGGSHDAFVELTRAKDAALGHLRVARL